MLATWPPHSLVIIERLNQILQHLNTQIPWTISGTPPTLLNQSLADISFSYNLLKQLYLELPNVL
jgi:hypothetical protein